MTDSTFNLPPMGLANMLDVSDDDEEELKNESSPASNKTNGQAKNGSKEKSSPIMISDSPKVTPSKQRTKKQGEVKFKSMSPEKVQARPHKAAFKQANKKLKEKQSTPRKRQESPLEDEEDENVNKRPRRRLRSNSNKTKKMSESRQLRRIIEEAKNNTDSPRVTRTRKVVSKPSYELGLQEVMKEEDQVDQGSGYARNKVKDSRKYKKIFANIYFIVTGNFTSRAKCEERILKRGGQLLKTNRSISQLLTDKKVVCVSDRIRRTTKYFYAVAMGACCVKPDWISYCHFKNTLVTPIQSKWILNTKSLAQLDRDNLSILPLQERLLAQASKSDYYFIIVITDCSSTFADTWEAAFKHAGVDVKFSYDKNAQMIVVPYIEEEDEWHVSEKTIRFATEMAIPIVSHIYLFNCIIENKMVSLNPKHTYNYEDLNLAPSFTPDLSKIVYTQIRSDPLTKEEEEALMADDSELDEEFDEKFNDETEIHSEDETLSPVPKHRDRFTNIVDFKVQLNYDNPMNKNMKKVKTCTWSRGSKKYSLSTGDVMLLNNKMFAKLIEFQVKDSQGEYPSETSAKKITLQTHVFVEPKNLLSSDQLGSVSKDSHLILNISEPIPQPLTSFVQIATIYKVPIPPNVDEKCCLHAFDGSGLKNIADLDYSFHWTNPICFHEWRDPNPVRPSENFNTYYDACIFNGHQLMDLMFVKCLLLTPEGYITLYARINDMYQKMTGECKIALQHLNENRTESSLAFTSTSVVRDYPFSSFFSIVPLTMVSKLNTNTSPFGIVDPKLDSLLDKVPASIRRSLSNHLVQQYGIGAPVSIEPFRKRIPTQRINK